MRKITREEAEKFTIKRGSATAVRTSLEAMEVGEILLIEQKDWKPKNGPGQMLSRVREKTGRQFKLDIIASGEGWLVERLK